MGDFLRVLEEGLQLLTLRVWGYKKLQMSVLGVKLSDERWSTSVGQGDGEERKKGVEKEKEGGRMNNRG